MRSGFFPLEVKLNKILSFLYLRSPILNLFVSLAGIKTLYISCRINCMLTIGGGRSIFTVKQEQKKKKKNRKNETARRNGPLLSTLAFKRLSSPSKNLPPPRNLINQTILHVPKIAYNSITFSRNINHPNKLIALPLRRYSLSTHL